MKKNLLLLVLFAVSMMAFPFAVSAQAQTTEYQKALQKLFAISGGFVSAEVMVTQTIEMMRQNMPSVSEEYLKELSTVMKEKVLNRMVEIKIPIYQKYLTLGDLKQIIAFYESPVGKKLATDAPLISKENLQVAEKLGREIAADIQKALQSYGK